ncbi:MAG: hypothetical protein IJY62_05950 [Clostridia bacterium]|nr:hypothetical protein [Clostridia bacterium]
MEEKADKKIIVFVCTGNTCRSPMAEAVFRSELKRRRIENAEVYSAGLRAQGNGTENINPKSAAVLAENGLSVENFHARRLDGETVRAAFAIVCMTDDQRDLLMELRWNILRKEGAEEIENNVWSFSELCGYEIPDPYGGDLETYRTTFDRITSAMPPLFEKFFAKTEANAAPVALPKRKRGRPKKTESAARSNGEERSANGKGRAKKPPAKSGAKKKDKKKD